MSSREYNVRINIQAVDKLTPSIQEISSALREVVRQNKDFAKSISDVGQEAVKSSQTLQNTANSASNLGDASINASNNISTLRTSLRNAATEANAVERAFKLVHDAAYDVAEVFQGISGIVGKVQNMFTQYQVTQIRLTELQERVAYAQEKYNEAVAKYGANSRQAQEAAKKLADAQRDLEVATLQANMQLVGFALQIPGLAKNVLDLGAKIADLTAGKQALAKAAQMLGLQFDGLSKSTVNLANNMGNLSSTVSTVGVSLKGVLGLVSGFTALFGGVAIASELTVKNLRETAEAMPYEELEKTVNEMRRQIQVMQELGYTEEDYSTILVKLQEYEYVLNQRRQERNDTTQQTIKIEDDHARVLGYYKDIQEYVQKVEKDRVDLLSSLAKTYGLNIQTVISLANKMFGLNISYDENAKLVEELKSRLGLTDDQAKQFIQTLEQEKAKLQESKKAVDDKKVSLEELGQKLSDAVGKLLEFGKVQGPLADEINKVVDALNDFKSAGGEVPSIINEMLGYYSQLNKKLSDIEESQKRISALQSIASTGLDYYNTLQSIQNALIAERLLQAKKDLEEMEKELALKKEAASKSKSEAEALKGVIDQLQEKILAKKQEIKAMEDSVKLTIEQEASQERLNAIQKTLGFTSQILSLQQMAVQMAMLGASESSKTLMDATYYLVGAMTDGIITEDEMKKMLEMLGVTFTETGQPVINLQNIMQQFRQEVENNINKVNNFRDALKNLDGMTIHTYHYHHIITVGGGKPGTAEEWRRYEEEMPKGYAPPAVPTKSMAELGVTTLAGHQHGLWNVPYDNYIARLHRGEMVLPRGVAEWFRRGGAGQKIVNVNVNVNAGGVVDPYQLAEIVSRQLVKRLRAM